MNRSLEIKDDPAFEAKEHLVKKFGWSALAVFVLAGALGLFGESRLALRERHVGRASLEYSRFARKDSETPLKFSVRNPNSPEESVWISASYLSAIKLEKITPEPVRSETSGEGVLFTFANDGGGNLEISMDVKPAKIGKIEGQIAQSPNGHRLAFTQFVYF